VLLEFSECVSLKKQINYTVLYTTSSLLQNSVRLTAAECKDLQPNFQQNVHDKENCFL